MSWTKLTPSSGTWTTPTVASVVWSPVTANLVPPPWAMFKSIISTDDGVDFQLVLRDDFPIYLHEERPVVLMDLQPEAAP